MAGPVQLDTWYAFSFTGPGSALLAGSGADSMPGVVAAPAPAWTIDLAGPGQLSVVDGFLPGDLFGLTDDGDALGTTSRPGAGPGFGGTVTACLADTAMSRGSFALTAGENAIQGVDETSPYGAGVGFFEITAVPEPGTLAPFGSGLGLLLAGRLGGLARRRRAA